MSLDEQKDVVNWRELRKRAWKFRHPRKENSVPHGTNLRFGSSALGAHTPAMLVGFEHGKEGEYRH
jgi:hypothetical protein